MNRPAQIRNHSRHLSAHALAVGGIAHIKFLTFSRTKAPNGVVYPDVVWFASYNAAGQSGNLDSNSSTSIYNAAASYDGLTTHQIRMQAQTHYPDNDYYDRASGRGYFYDPAAHLMDPLVSVA